MNSNITGDTHSISVQDGRLILTWQGWYFPPTPGAIRRFAKRSDAVHFLIRNRYV
jgi:hypothetical protein